MKPTITDYTDCRIKQGARFDGDNSFWIVADGREDEGPFDSEADATIYLRDCLRAQWADSGDTGAAFPHAFKQLDNA